MKKLFILLSFLLFSITSFCQYPDAATIKKNKIKIIGLSGMSGTTYRLYDENGMGVKGSYMDEEFKKPEWERKIFYNEKGLPDSIHSIGYSKSKTYYKYSTDGSFIVIEIERMSSDTSYYTKDNKIKERRNSNGSKTKYEYNAKRQLIKKTETQGDAKSVTTFIYNAAGLVQLEKTTGADNRTYEYTYDKKGLLIKEISDYGSGSKMTTTYFYKFWETSPVAEKVKTSNLATSFVFNESGFTINGSTFNAQQMLVENFYKPLGKPEKTDTLNDKTITNYNFLEMATLNKYNSAGILLKQGKQTSRVNRLSIFLNPDPQAKFIDYINTSYSGKLTVLGLKIDSQTLVKQLQKTFEKYNLDVSEEFKVADMTIYDKKTNARLLEIKFNLTASLEKIEYIELKYFPNEPTKKHKLEYRDKQLSLDGILLDTSTGKSIALKKIMGAPNGVFDYDYRMGSKIIKVKEYVYRSIKGISFIENPANNSLIHFKMDFLALRKKSELANPLIDFIINGKSFNPEKPVLRSQNEIKSIFNFDSTNRVTNKTTKKTSVIAFEPSGNLEFEFNGDLDWYKSVYSFSYTLKQPTNLPVIEVFIEPPAPTLNINNGQVWLQVKGKTIHWGFGNDIKSKFFEGLGNPSKILSNTVSEFAEFGFRVWINVNGLKDLLVFLSPIKYSINNKEQSPGIFKGIVEIDGKKINKEMTFEDINSLLSNFIFKEAYTTTTEKVYVGENKQIKMYWSFHKSSGKLSNFSISLK